MRQTVRTLNPSYFALVMATGVVAISTDWLGVPVLPTVLTWFNIGAYALLAALTAARVALYPRLFWTDLTDHTRGAGFFTLVAGTAVLGNQILVVMGNYAAAAGFWWAALILWGALTYTIFTVFTVKDPKPSLPDGINGGWLVSVVATQAVANLGALLAPYYSAARQEMLFLALVFWLAGGMLYIWMISIIFYRYTFFRFSPSDLAPPYWINMGAMAISALAGTTLIAQAPSWSFLERLVPFLNGLTLLFWATATWWIPMLVILGFWRHVYKRFRLTYDPLYWGAVFPLGMYTASTFKLARVTGLERLVWIPRGFVWVALAAWGAAFLGLLRSSWRGAGGLA